MKILVGYTGFVGSNLYKNTTFDAVYNSKNIQDAFGTNPDLLIYSGIRAEKYLANNFPENDLTSIIEAQNNIKKINPKKIVLISTIDVIKTPIDTDEDFEIVTEDLHPYGYHRYLLEQFVKDNYSDSLIVRLPGLYGKNIKKNFIYDFINKIPSMLNAEKFIQFKEKHPSISKYYDIQNNGFYKLKEINEQERLELLNIFNKLHFSSLNFSDSRSIYQFYNLERLWGDIEIALNNNINILHLATEPVSVYEIYKYITGEDFKNEISLTPANYNYKTKYDYLFNGKNGYMSDKKYVLEDIKNFIKNYN